MTYRIVQITDCHLFAEREHTLRGLATWPRFEAIVECVRSQLADADLLVLTGDMAHDERAATYATMARQLAAWGERVRVIPGNHDDRSLLHASFATGVAGLHGRVAFHVRWHDWQVIGLDSQRPGALAGSLGPVQLDWLRSQLQQHEVPTIVFVHHPPVSVGSAWLDKIGLDDAAKLAELLQEFQHVRLIGCGHIHQELAASLGEAVVFATPAVGPQFRPRVEELEIEPAPPACRVFELRAGGMWSTQVLRSQAGGHVLERIDGDIGDPLSCEAGERVPRQSRHIEPREQ